MILFPSIFNSPEENCVNAVERLVKELKVDVTKSTIRKQLKEHPDYPSLLSIGDVLDTWKISNFSINVTSKNKLHELPLPFIAQIDNGGTCFFVTVKKISERKIIVSDLTVPKWRTVDEKDFVEQWTGIVMLAEPEINAGEFDFEKIRQTEFIGAVSKFAAFLLLILSWGFATTNIFLQTGVKGLPEMFLLSLKLLGVLISGFLLSYQLGNTNSNLAKVCQAGKKTNCKSILNSKASQLIPGISWSEVGFIYFSAGFIGMLIMNLLSVSPYLLTWLSVVAMPYTFFSIYYQWKVARQWCVLCLLVQLLLILEFLTFIFSDYLREVPLPSLILEVVVIVFSLLLPAIGWFMTRSFLKAAKLNEEAQRDYVRLKYDRKVFEGLLLHERKLQREPEGLGIVLGNPLAKNKIIKVCNPYCGPCAKAHYAIEMLLAKCPNAQVRIIFTASNNDADARSYPTKHLLAIAEKKDEDLLHQALDGWYNSPKKDYKEFASRFSGIDQIDNQEKKIEDMSEWCRQTEIAFTPTYFVNGYQLPQVYTIQDLKYLLST